VVIPRELHKSLGISVGQKISFVAVGDRIEFIPVKPARALRGCVGHRLDRPTRERAGVNLVNSSGWLEYFADGRNARFFANEPFAPALTYELT
jgi:hypothetical protein